MLINECIDVKDIEPRFVDFSNDLQKDLIGEVPMLYKQNKENTICDERCKNLDECNHEF